MLDASPPRCLRLTRRVSARAIFVGVLLILTSLFPMEGVTQNRVPSAPTGLTATAGENQVTLNWTAPSDAGSHTITHYEYFMSSSQGNVRWTSTGSTSTTYTRTNLRGGLEYTFTVRAVSAAGNGTGSTSVAARPTIPAPTNFTATRGDGRVQLNWTRPTNSFITLYEYSTDGGTTWVQFGDTNTTNTTVTGLTNGTEYTFVLRARRGNLSIGTTSASVTVTPNVAAPTGLTATAGDGQVTLSWTAPSGFSITSYEYQRDSEAWASAGTASPYTVTGLTNGTQYTFKVRAVGSGGGGTASSSVTATPNIAAPTGLRATAGDREVTLSWTAPSTTSTITNYEYLQNSGTWTSTGSTDTTYTVTGLTNRTSYTFSVRTVSGTVKGTESSSVTATPGIPAPTGLRATAGDGQVTLSWTAPSVSTITDYEYSTGNGWISTGSTDTTYIVSGLTNGTSYTFRVRAVSGTDAGTESVSATATPSAAPPPSPEDTTPGTTEGLTVNRVNSRAVTLSWQAPTSLNAQAIAEYQYSIDGGRTWISTGSTTTSITITGDGFGNLPLTNFKIRAMNRNADGTSSVVIISAPATPQKPRRVIQDCPVGWVRSDGFAGRNRRVLLYEVNVEMDLRNPVSIYKPIWVAIYVHPDEGLENLNGWKLQVAVPYNHHRDYLLTAENSVVVDAGFVEGGFAFIANPEENPFPMTGIGFAGSPAPGFDYRLYDETGRRVDFGISCYKRFDVFQVLKNLEDPRVLRNVSLKDIDWNASWFIRSEWTLPLPVNVPGAPSAPGVNLVGKWADLKKQ